MNSEKSMRGISSYTYTIGVLMASVSSAVGILGASVASAGRRVTCHRPVHRLGIALFVAVLLLCPLSLFAQKITDIKKDAAFLWGEGRAADTRTADSVATDALVKKIAGVVELPYREAVKTALMETYRNDVAGASDFAVSGGRKGTTVLRYIRRDAVGNVFENRRRRIAEMKDIAGTAETKLQMDVALRYLSWAAVLLQSVPGFKAEDVAELRSRRVRILEGMNVRFDRQSVADKEIVELSFTYRGQPVRNIDYRFFNGREWSGVMSAKDGKGFIEVSPGSRIDDYRILYESDPSHLRHIYREVQAVERAFGAASGTGSGSGASASGGGSALAKSSGRSAKSPSGGFDAPDNRGLKHGGLERGDDAGCAGSEASGNYAPPDAVAVSRIDFSAVRSKVMDVMSREKFSEAADSTGAVSLAPVLFTSEYEAAVSRICDALKKREYESVRPLFTETGYDIFLRLVAYGNARVLSHDDLSFYALGDEVWCRGIPMAFSFSGNPRRFVEDIVLTFNKDGLISNLTFSLGAAATSDICSHEGWTEEARLILVDFLENYKTAYSLRRLDYISSIFDDDALIITGRVLRSAGLRNEYGSNRYVSFTRQNKATYIRNLSRVFASQEYINIQFSDSEVVKLGKGEQLFGIKIRQEYFSTTYSDVGYLFVLVDLSDWQRPVIHVRTWQESPDKDFGVIGPYHF
mgnify:CR=1 FL=1